MHNKWSKKCLVPSQYKLKWCEGVSFPLTYCRFEATSVTEIGCAASKERLLKIINC